MPLPQDWPFPLNCSSPKCSVCYSVIATRKTTDSFTYQRTGREILVQVEALARGSHGIYPHDISCIKRVHSIHACIVYPPSGSKNEGATAPNTYLPLGIADGDRIHIWIWLPDRSFPNMGHIGPKPRQAGLCSHLEMWYYICLIHLFTRLTFWYFHFCQSFWACFVSFSFYFFFTCFTLSEQHYIFLITLLLSASWPLYLHTIWGCPIITKYSFKSIWLFFR